MAFALEAEAYVGVDAGGDADGACPRFLDDDEVDALFQEQGRGRVLEVVEADRPEPYALEEALTISRNNRFAIEVIGDPASEGGVSSPSEVAGRVTVGDFSESFPIDLSFWTVADYSRSWERALRELEASENSTSCLISSITDPETANFIFCWPIYREEEAVHVQNSIILLDGLEEEFNPQEPWRYVEARSLVDEDGNQISEWSTTISEVRRFRESIGGQ